MPDNSFEHKLNRQMEDFKYPVSEAVWQNLEANLLKRKKRRRAIIWFFSGLLLVSAGLYFFARPSMPDMNGAIVSNNVKSAILENLPIVQGNGDTVSGRQKRKTEVFAEKESLKKNDEEIPVNKDIDKRKPEIIVYGGNQKGKPVIPKTINRKDIHQPEIINEGTAGKALQEEKFPAENTVSESGINQIIREDKKEEAIPSIKVTKDSDSNNLNQKIEHTVADSGSVIKVNINQTQTDSLVIGKNDQKLQKPKRQVSFGLRFEAGRSANSESSLTQNKAADMVSGPSAGGPVVYSYPYTQEPGFAFSIGVWARKPISGRVNLQTGLTYHNYRTSTPVGEQGQGGLQVNNGSGDIRYSPYFRQGDSENYTNSYHLLSVPFELAVQMNKGKKLPVHWQFGIDPGWMIGSNAILKSTDSTGFLYSDKNKFNRFQFGIQTGLSFRFFQKAKHAIEVGPVFQYMLTPAFKSGSGYDGHLNFLGLRADWVFR